jgi:two-component system chemotaxis response regulator CheY
MSYETYCNELARICIEVFQKMTQTEVVNTVVKRDQRADANYAVAFHVKYEHLKESLGGSFTLGFTDSDMAVAVASTIAETMGLEAPNELNQDALDLLNEFMNTIFGRAVAAWDKLGFSARFHPPTFSLNTVLRAPNEFESVAYVIILSLKVHHVTFRVAFVKDLSQQLNGKKILVVDDSAVIRKVVSMHLKAAGFEVAEAVDGQDAVEKHPEFKPDLTIIDQVMPRLNGLDAILEIKQNAPKAKFIMLTSTSRKDEIVTARTLGVVNYLLKPLQVPDLMSAVAKALRIQM